MTEAEFWLVIVAVPIALYAIPPIIGGILALKNKRREESDMHAKN